MRKATVRVIAALILIAPLAACHQTDIGQAVGFPKPDKPQQFQNGR
jgi:hypothetical protein